MTDDEGTKPRTPKAPTDMVTDQAISTLIRSMINALVSRAREEDFGKTALDKLEYTLMDKNRSDALLKGINAFNGFLSARAAERQAKALETIANQSSTQRIVQSASDTAQAIIDAREPRREHLTLTYPVPTELATFLWAVRGVLMDAAAKSLSRPDRFDPYQRVSTEDLAYTFRLSAEDFYAMLPKTTAGALDMELLEAFDILHYGGDSEHPDDWMFGG